MKTPTRGVSKNTNIRGKGRLTGLVWEMEPPGDGLLSEIMFLGISLAGRVDRFILL